MNRLVLLLVFLITFLSCGNSSSGLNPAPAIKILDSKANRLSPEQKLMSNRLDSLFRRLYTQRQFNGSVLVSKAGKIIYSNQFGLQDRNQNRYLSDSSMFQLASVSKVITATAVLMLYERDMLDLDKKFSDYFPDFPYPNIRVRELLNHRSGLPNYIYTLNSELYRPEYRMSNEDMYRFMVQKNSRPYYRPNYRFNYCNTNYALLALLVERVSGKDFQDFLREELFEPLGMKHTATIRDIDLDGENVTKAYDMRWRPVDMDASDYVLGDKSIYSTAYDLYLFSEAMYQNRIIKPETQAKAYTAYSREVKLSNYGFGWRMKNFRDPQRKEVYHNGWWHGYRTAFHRRLSDTLTVVILSNQLNKTTYQTYKVYDILDKTNVVVLGEDED
ncbi:MAG TPA: serine hydrolase domain-containing protein [Bacteroidia bacterium]|nr:serine hydrolase domain-containing protein [Bacteroidia bacterium]